MALEVALCAQRLTDTKGQGADELEENVPLVCHQPTRKRCVTQDINIYIYMSLQCLNWIGYCSWGLWIFLAAQQRGSPRYQGNLVAKGSPSGDTLSLSCEARWAPPDLIIDSSIQPPLRIDFSIQTPPWN